ncbi:hypothetical protein [Paenibacillus apii]|uniref:hypothetical protein n=1 Tax=Paenibacillus apii TaxID=1850370 RepID=UPI00143B9BDC|nr:hypothetical protein [Paenibacillus apii]NJJ38395.1 hypothetical protein [Paenibacillus apii]
MENAQQALALEVIEITNAVAKMLDGQNSTDDLAKYIADLLFPELPEELRDLAVSLYKEAAE